MKAEAIIEGLQIINSSRPKTENSYHVRAEHDEIIAGDLDWTMSEKNAKRLEKLGWQKEEDYNGWVANV